jgi:putative transposase
MKKTKFSEERIAYILRQAEGGTTATEVCRQNGISEQTSYRWKRKYGGMGVPELHGRAGVASAAPARRLRQLEEENNKLKQLVADLSLD